MALHPPVSCRVVLSVTTMGTRLQTFKPQVKTSICLALASCESMKIYLHLVNLLSQTLKEHTVRQLEPSAVLRQQPISW